MFTSRGGRLEAVINHNDIFSISTSNNKKSKGEKGDLRRFLLLNAKTLKKATDIVNRTANRNVNASTLFPVSFLCLSCFRFKEHKNITN